MNEILFRGLDAKEKEEFKRLLAHSSLIRRIREILVEFEKQTNNKVTDYDSPSWAYRQADKNGEARAYSKILNLLDSKDKDV